jgi:hypothetical protein
MTALDPDGPSYSIIHVELISDLTKNVTVRGMNDYMEKSICSLEGFLMRDHPLGARYRMKLDSIDFQ